MSDTATEVIISTSLAVGFFLGVIGIAGIALASFIILSLWASINEAPKRKTAQQELDLYRWKRIWLTSLGLVCFSIISVFAGAFLF